MLHSECFHTETDCVHPCNLAKLLNVFPLHTNQIFQCFYLFILFFYTRILNIYISNISFIFLNNISTNSQCCSDMFWLYLHS